MWWLIAVRGDVDLDAGVRMIEQQRMANGHARHAAVTMLLVLGAPPRALMEPPVGIEPTTSRLQGECSGQLSYRGDADQHNLP
jgi:hypothetical protein